MSQLVERLGQDSQLLLRKELLKELRADDSVTTKTLIKQGKTYRIRCFTDLLSGDQRQEIKILREVLSAKGVTGKWKKKTVN